MAKHSRQEVPSERRNRLRPVGAEATAVGHNAFARAGFADETLVLHWAEIVGQDVARLAVPLRMSEGAQGGVLTLGAEPAAAVFLQHESRTLCARINGYLGRQAVGKIRFVDAAPRQMPQPDRPSAARSAVADSDPVREFVGPDRLKNALVGLAQLRRGRNRGD